MQPQRMPVNVTVGHIVDHANEQKNTLAAGTIIDLVIRQRSAKKAVNNGRNLPQSRQTE